MDRRKYINCAGYSQKLTLFIVYLVYVREVTSTVDIKYLAYNLSQDITGMKNKELGIPYITKLYSSFKDTSPSVGEVTTNLNAMAQKLRDKVQNVSSSLMDAQNILETNKALLNATNIPSIFVPCFPVNIKMDTKGIFADNGTFNLLEVGSVLLKIKTDMRAVKNAIKQQYIISENEVQTSKLSPFSFCIKHDDSIVWKNYMLRNNYNKRNVILVLDHGGSLSKRQLHIVKSVAKEMISSLSKTDRVALIGIASDWFTPEASSECLIPNQITKPVNVTPSLSLASSSHKQTLYKFVDALTRGSGATNHTLGIENALEIVKNEASMLQNETVMILYISRGLLSSLMEAKVVLETIAAYTDSIETSVVINTCAVIDESKTVLYETHFLRNIAEQNYDNYNISYKKHSARNVGLMLAINSSDSIGYATTLFYNIFNPRASFKTDKMISLPMWDSVSNDLSITLSLGWISDNQFTMLGVDIYFANIAEDITYYSSNQENSYAFLLDINGLVLMHPSFPRPSAVNHQLSFFDIGRFENVKDIELFKERLLTEVEGEHNELQDNGTNVIKYIWKRVDNWYIICIAVNNKYAPINRPPRYPSASNSKLFYQNLNRADEYKLCKHLNQLATTDASSLYLSMSCFKSPFYASTTTQDNLIEQGYLAYLKDDTTLLANPGLKDEVRDEVIALAHVIEFLRQQQLNSHLSKYIVRKYVTSYSGVLQMFPGSSLGPGLEPTKRPWFLRSLQHQDKIVFIPPYIDGGGAGYIVTMSYATSQAVVAMDITYGYMYKMLLDYMPFCLEEKITCFLMDDQGYLIYHPDLMVLNEERPVEQKHIVHKESLVANDILNHKHFIRKLLCNNYGNNTIQRYYRLNTSFSDVLANSVPGEHCVSYRITSVPNTNIFVGVVNATCDVVATFCPCSVIDRLCLNCNRMEQKECECPCECPLNIDTEVCHNVNQNISHNLPCMWFTEDVALDAVFEETEKKLDSCFPVDCQAEQTYIDCLGLIGCEWCKFDSNGKYLRKPFCSSLQTCFNGVFGSPSPYRNNDMELPNPVNQDFNPIGPILGSIIAMCILFVLLFVCYRSYTTPSTERLYLSSTQDNQLRMSDLNVNDNYHDLGNHRDKLLQEDRQNPISPYCVASTYRRATAAADSDHGYSTMTPHDESEHLSLAPVEGDSLEDDLTSDNASIHTSVSAKHNIMSPPMFTRLPNKNCIVVPVTVHRNMEAS